MRLVELVKNNGEEVVVTLCTTCVVIGVPFRNGTVKTGSGVIVNCIFPFGVPGGEAAL